MRQTSIFYEFISLLHFLLEEPVTNPVPYFNAFVPYLDEDLNEKIEIFLNELENLVYNFDQNREIVHKKLQQFTDEIETEFC